MRKEFEQLNKLIEDNKDKNFIIFTHNNPDPDAIGAALGISWFLKRNYEISSKVYYGGEISHPQNKTLVNVLDAMLYHQEEYKDSDDDFRIIVDSTTKNSYGKANVVIDHHKVTDESVDLAIIDKVGSASTIVYELIAEFIDFEELDQDDSDMVVALYFGIRNDTQDLVSDNVTDRDWSAVQALTPHINRKKLNSIVNYSFPPYFLELEKSINDEANFEKGASYFVGSVGRITPVKRDCLPMIADKMLRLEGMETVVVFGMIENRFEFSIRSQNSSLDVHKFAKDLICKKSAGGKQGAAGGTYELPTELLYIQDAPMEIQDELHDVYKKVVFARVTKILTGE